MSDEKAKPASGASALLGDLESIRTLLDEQDDGSAAAAEDIAHDSAVPEPQPEDLPSDDDVPLLEDVVHGGVSLKETFFAGEGDFVENEDAGGLDDDIFKALLSDEWRDSARGLLDEARGVIEQHQNEWTPEHTDELNAALKVRIDETLERWLHELVQRHIGDLRETLLRSVGDELEHAVRQRLGAPPAPSGESLHEDPDGE